MSLLLGMPSTSSILLMMLLLLLLMIALLARKRRRRIDDVTRAPAVEGALPLLGNVLGIDRRHPHFTLTDWADVYGHVYG